METDKTTKKGKAKVAKEPKPKKAKVPKTPKPDLCVFAFRLPLTDRDLVHKAADAKEMSATKFVVETILEASRKVLDRA
jgi:hypothetical protein